ncbi:hypothetical protein JK628_23140 (plasmid) [Shewanella sp. KX20019]|uniref:hypothetical protein n=1 Tax=Shewanella sp. KX20019 TaxID=2803864 RepID=UPI001928841A|nr:hypothetical protein [Shewanella sp. KX20019]QQX82679.1 hypothetical protein JK628_23140 [Shewanella sp. KX20019]
MRDAKRHLENFIILANEIHANKYDYSKSIYLGSTKKVEIVCNVHGSFWQMIGNHIRGHGCPKCAGRGLLTPENFKARCNEIHANKYDYSLVNCSRQSDTIKIICNVHGEFKQKAELHISGSKCPECVQDEKIKKRYDNFIEKAKAAHGDHYDYSRVEYVKAVDNVIIICPVHGEFKQTPGAHAKGTGCAKCSAMKRYLEDIEKHRGAV